MKSGWKRIPLGKIAELRGRIGWRGLTAKEYTKEGPLFLSVHSLNYGDYVDFRDAFHISEARFLESPEIVVAQNDILICKDGAGIGKVGIVGAIPGPTTINSSLLMIRSGPDVLPKFLYRCLMSPYFQDIVQSRLSGATTPHLYQRDITEFPIVLPPTSEQQRIVCILDKAFETISTAKVNAKRNLQNARALFDTALQNAFARHERKLVCLSEISNEITDGDHMPPPKAGEGIPFITISDIRKKDRSLDFSDTFLVPESYFEKLKPNKKPSPGDILYTVTGATLGIPVLVRNSAKFCFQRHIALIRPKPAIDSRWLNYTLLSPQVFHQATQGATGAAQKTVSLKVLRSFRVPQISKSDQILTAETLEDVEKEAHRLESIYQKKCEALDELKKSLLHQAFAGQL